jgi:hypothetical protein
MRVKLSMLLADAEELRTKVLEAAEKVEREETGQTDWEIVGTHILSSSYANRTLPDHAHRPGTIPPYQ